MDDSRFDCVTDYTYALVVACEDDFRTFLLEKILWLLKCVYVKELKRFNYVLHAVVLNIVLICVLCLALIFFF